MCITLFLDKDYDPEDDAETVLQRSQSSRHYPRVAPGLQNVFQRNSLRSKSLGRPGAKGRENSLVLWELYLWVLLVVEASFRVILIHSKLLCPFQPLPSPLSYCLFAGPFKTRLFRN